MMKKSKLMALILSSILSIGVLAGCSSDKAPETPGETPAAGNGAQVVLRYGDVNPEGHVLLDSAAFFAEKVDELTNGEVKIEIYPSGQLGDDNEVYQALQMGAVDLYRGNSASLTDFGSMEVTALALPYIFRDRDHFWAVAKGEVGRGILENISETGSRMKGLFYMDEGARNFFTTDAPVTMMEDLKNLKIRVQNSALMLDTISALGANPTPIDYAELYTSLQTGVVDGAENPPASYYSNKFYEVAPYYVLDGLTYAPSVVLMSEITWGKLSKEHQDALVEAGKLTEDFNKDAIQAADEKAYEDLKAAGVEITELEDAEKWAEAMKPVYEKHGANFLELIEEVKAVK